MDKRSPATQKAIPEGYSDEQLEAGVKALRYMYSKLGEHMSDETLCGCIYDAMIAKRAPSETGANMVRVEPLPQQPPTETTSTHGPATSYEYKIPGPWAPVAPSTGAASEGATPRTDAVAPTLNLSLRDLHNTASSLRALARLLERELADALKYAEHLKACGRELASSSKGRIDICREYEILTGDMTCPLGHADALREIQRRLDAACIPSATERPSVSAPPGVTVTVNYEQTYGETLQHHAPLWIEARITRIDHLGLGFIENTATAGRYYPFTFDRIDRYSGESPYEIGLREGRVVGALIKDGKVERVCLDGIPASTGARNT